LERQVKLQYFEPKEKFRLLLARMLQVLPLMLHT
jgi:hypothetical protein